MTQTLHAQMNKIKILKKESEPDNNLIWYTRGK
jgi:hypothetical protein